MVHIMQMPAFAGQPNGIATCHMIHARIQQQTFHILQAAVSDGCAEGIRAAAAAGIGR